MQPPSAGPAPVPPVPPSPPTFPPLTAPSLAARLQASEAKPAKVASVTKPAPSDTDRQKLKLGEVEAIAARLLAAGRASSVARSAVLASLPPQGANPVVDALRAALSREAAAEVVAKAPGDPATRTVVPLPVIKTSAGTTPGASTQGPDLGAPLPPTGVSAAAPGARAEGLPKSLPSDLRARGPAAANLPPRPELPIQLPRLTQSRMAPTSRAGGHVGSVVVGLALAGALGSLVYIMLGPKDFGSRRSEVKQMVRDLAALERKGEEQAAKLPQQAAPSPAIVEAPAAPPPAIAFAPPAPPPDTPGLEPRVEAKPEPPAVTEKPPREVGRDAAIVASVITPKIEPPPLLREMAPPAASFGPGDDEQMLERVTLDIQDGNRLMRSGDVESAKRRYFQAARAGSAEAAAALARTYDPFHLAALERANVKPDPREALRWYKIAVERGLSAFGEQIARLEAQLSGTEPPRSGMKPLSATIEPGPRFIENSARRP